MPEIELYITDRPTGPGTKDVMRRMYQYSDLEVVHALNDGRECRFRAPIYDINALNQSNVQHFLPLRRFVKVFYRNHLVFWGPIVKPIFNFKDNTVEVNATDCSFWLKHHHFHVGDDALTGVDYTGDGMWDLARAAKLTASETASGFKDLPMVEGFTDSAGALSVEYRPERGANVWDAMIELAESAAGPDFDIVPIDEDHNDGGFWTSGMINRLDAFEESDFDLSDEVIFHFGWGRTNLDNMIHEPDGAMCINRFIAQADQGSTMQVAKYGDGMQSVGIVEAWETAPARHISTEGLGLWARGFVEAYGAIPDTFTIEPTWDMGLMGSAASTPWRYPSTIYPGFRIRAVGKIGRLDVDLIGRITRVTLSQINAAENVRSQVEVIPTPTDIADDVVVEDDV